jgi:hypothetical protein
LGFATSRIGKGLELLLEDERGWMIEPGGAAGPTGLACSGGILTAGLDHLVSHIGSLHSSHIFVGPKVIASHIGSQRPKDMIVMSRFFQ